MHNKWAEAGENVMKEKTVWLYIHSLRIDLWIDLFPVRSMARCLSLYIHLHMVSRNSGLCDIRRYYRLSPEKSIL